MIQIQGNPSLPVSLPKTLLRLSSCSAALAFPSPGVKNSGNFVTRDARICTASTNHANVQVTSDDPTLTTSRTSFPSAGWAEFSEKISGEWDGFGADFTADGMPIELPESVVPDAYREWDVKVFDWQTQCPTLAHSNLNVPYFTYKAIKLLPTVGCEADAATRYTIQERNLTAPHLSAFAYQSSGCYVAVWPIINNIKTANFELEHCLIDPRDKESRIRVIQVLGFNDSELRLQSIKIFVEQWYGPFRNGDQLGGCAIRSSGFATTQSLDVSQVTGSWQGINSAATFHKSQNIIQQLGNEYASQSIRDVSNCVLLPKNLWSSFTRRGTDEIHCEVGWLLNHGRAITSKCFLSSTAEVKEIAIAEEENAASLVE